VNGLEKIKKPAHGERKLKGGPDKKKKKKTGDENTQFNFGFSTIEISVQIPKKTIKGNKALRVPSKSREKG